MSMVCWLAPRHPPAAVSVPPSLAVSAGAAALLPDAASAAAAAACTGIRCECEFEPETDLVGCQAHNRQQDTGCTSKWSPGWNRSGRARITGSASSAAAEKLPSAALHRDDVPDMAMILSKRALWVAVIGVSKGSFEYP